MHIHIDLAISPFAKLFNEFVVIKVSAAKLYQVKRVFLLILLFVARS